MHALKCARGSWAKAARTGHRKKGSRDGVGAHILGSLDIGDGFLKLHRRTTVLDGRRYTILTVRPGDDSRFATNYFHETWHVLSDWHGARVLAQLLWGLSYQRHPKTLIVLDNLDPNPFDAAPSIPVVLAESPLTPLSEKAARQLRKQLPLRHRPEGTVKLQTPGLTKAIEEFRQWRDNPHAKRHTDYALRSRQKVSTIGGLIVLAGGTLTLRDWAVSMAELGTYARNGMDYTYLAGRDGEVQIFRQYRREVSIAKQARRDVLANPRPGHDHCCLNIRIWRQAEKIRLRSLKPLPAKEDALPAGKPGYETVPCPRCQATARRVVKPKPRIVCLGCVYVSDLA